MQHTKPKYIHYCQRYSHFDASVHWRPKKDKFHIESNDFGASSRQLYTLLPPFK